MKLPWRKMALVCRMMMFLWACHWCLGGFTPDRVWSEEGSAQSSPNTGSSSKETSFWNPSADSTWRFFPTDEEVQRYRSSWNPFSHGPILANSPDVQPKGQSLLQLYVFSEVGQTQYGNRFTTSTTDSSKHLQAVAPTFFFGYGITDNLEVDIAPTLLWYNSFNGTGPALSSGHASPHANDFGIGDTTVYLKWRARVQDPDSWKGTFTIYNGVTLPSSQWFGTHPIPGGFSPLGRLPATKFGGLGLTEGLMWRKNIKPFRFMTSVYYTYTIPGSTGGISTYNGDIINTRAIIEYIADDKRGLGYSLEFLSVHGAPWRVDGHDLNLNPTSFNLIGVEPSVQYTFFHDESGGLVAAAGCLFSIAGQNDINAVYPNISMYYYWAKGGAPVMR